MSLTREECRAEFNSWEGPAVIKKKHSAWSLGDSKIKRFSSLVLQYIEPELHFTVGEGEYEYAFFIFKQNGNWFLSYTHAPDASYYLREISDRGEREQSVVSFFLNESRMFTTLEQLSGHVNAGFRDDFLSSGNQEIREAGIVLSSKIMAFAKTRGRSND